MSNTRNVSKITVSQNNDSIHVQHYFKNTGTHVEDVNQVVRVNGNTLFAAKKPAAAPAQTREESNESWLSLGNDD